MNTKVGTGPHLVATGVEGSGRPVASSSDAAADATGVVELNWHVPLRPESHCGAADTRQICFAVTVC